MVTIPTAGMTPTELKIIEVLQDGRRHTKEEIMDAVDPEGFLSSVWNYIHRMREKLEPGGFYIHFRREGDRTFYILTRSLGSE